MAEQFILGFFEWVGKVSILQFHFFCGNLAGTRTLAAIGDETIQLRYLSIQFQAVHNLMRRTAFVKRLEAIPESVLDEAYYKCAYNRRIINLGTAENRMMADFLVPLLRERPDMSTDDLSYQASFKDTDIQKAVASLYEAHFGMKNVNPEHIVVSMGCAMIVERLSLTLCEPGDVILIPAPCYGCFEPDMSVSGANFVFIDLDNLPEKPPENAKLLVLTNPGNPIGHLIQDPEKLLKWAYQVPGLHIVTDDIYGLSNREGKPFQSIMGLECADPMRVHHMYGISKDWGMAGFHLGFFYTRNDELRKQLRTAHACCFVPSDTKWLVAKMFSDKDWVNRYIVAYKERLCAREKILVDALEKAGVKYLTAPNSLFVMVDFTEFAGGSRENELRVWGELMDKYEVHIAPGNAGFRYPICGWFRICFSCEEEELKEAANRIIRAYNDMRAK